MRHRVKKHLHLSGKDQAHRKSVVRNLVSSLFEHQAIVTTKKRAQAIAPVVESLIEIAKGDHTEYNKIRLITPEVFTPKASRAVLDAAKSYKDRQGGYTRIIKAGFRYGDNAPMAVIEFVDRDEDAKGKDSGPVQTADADAA